MNKEQLDAVCMEMISNAGEGRGLVFEALESFQQDDYEAADQKLNQAQAFLAEAHKIQFEQLMSPQNKGVEIPFSMLLLHAMDLTMITTSEHDLLNAIVQGKLSKGQPSNP